MSLIIEIIRKERGGERGGLGKKKEPDEETQGSAEGLIK